jgi:hypothetical protein
VHDNDHLIPRNSSSSSSSFDSGNGVGCVIRKQIERHKDQQQSEGSLDWCVNLPATATAYISTIQVSPSNSSYIHGSARSPRFFLRDGLHKGCESLHPPDQAIPGLSQCASTHRQFSGFRGPVPASQRGQLCRTGWKAEVGLCRWRIRCRVIWYVSLLVMLTRAWLNLRTLTECRRIYERKAGFN